MTTRTRTVRLASEKQTDLIVRLAGEKDTSHFAEDVLADLNTVLAGEIIPSRDASDLIGVLFECKRKGAEAPSATEAGFYLHDGAIYRIRPGKRYAERLVLPYGVEDMTQAERRKAGAGTWEYARGIVYRLTVPLTVEEAAKFGRQWTFCAICGRYLENDESVARGIGPVCFKKF